MIRVMNKNIEKEYFIKNNVLINFLLKVLKSIWRHNTIIFFFKCTHVIENSYSFKTIRLSGYRIQFRNKRAAKCSHFNWFRVGCLSLWSLKFEIWLQLTYQWNKNTTLSGFRIHWFCQYTTLHNSSRIFVDNVIINN